MAVRISSSISELAFLNSLIDLQNDSGSFLGQDRQYYDKDNKHLLRTDLLEDAKEVGFEIMSS